VIGKAERLLALLQRLREQRGPATADALAETLGVSVRTIYRDIAALAAQGAPVEGAAGLGYVLREGYFLPPLALSGAEADAVALGLRFVMRRGDDALVRAAESALGKITAVLPPGHAAAAAHSGLLAAPAGSGAAAMLGSVRTAMEAGCKLQLQYRDRLDTVSERTVWPVALGFFDGAEVLAAWCELRDGWRAFRIDRIAHAAQLAEPLPRPRRVLLAAWEKAWQGEPPSAS
jgi:predicted DNA-binding transcriptional regulator YafY